MSEPLIKLTPPYYAVVFASKQKVMDQEYQDTANHLLGLAQKVPGFLGVEMAGGDDLTIGVIYWKTLESIESWKNHPEHIPAKEKGKTKWYADYRVRICKVEKEYGP